MNYQQPTAPLSPRQVRAMATQLQIEAWQEVYYQSRPEGYVSLGDRLTYISSLIQNGAAEQEEELPRERLEYAHRWYPNAATLGELLSSPSVAVLGRAPRMDADLVG